jgi:hypothetical protein
MPYPHFSLPFYVLYVLRLAFSNAQGTGTCTLVTVPLHGHSSRISYLPSSAFLSFRFPRIQLVHAPSYSDVIRTRVHVLPAVFHPSIPAYPRNHSHPSIRTCLLSLNVFFHTTHPSFFSFLLKTPFISNGAHFSNSLLFSPTDSISSLHSAFDSFLSCWGGNPLPPPRHRLSLTLSCQSLYILIPIYRSRPMK